MKIDMHVHTSRYSACSVMSPEEMAEAAIQAGLDGVVITEHDYLWIASETEQLQAKFGDLKILRGVEVSTVEGHFLVYGIDDNGLFFAGMGYLELARRVHQAGGIVAVSHPGRYSDDTPPEVLGCPPDAVEVASMNMLAHARAAVERATARLDAASIAGSDGHAVSQIGLYATDFNVPITCEANLVAAVASRSLTVWRDQQEIDQRNIAVDRRVAVTRHLMDEGFSADDIWLSHGIPHSFQDGVIEGKDMHLV